MTSSTEIMPVHMHISPKNSEGFAVNFPYSEEDVRRIKLVLGFAEFSKAHKSWLCEGPEVLLDMERFGIKPAWMSSEARVIAEDFRLQLWKSLEARQEPIYEEEYGYQRQGTKFLSLQRRAILGDDMGLGKTKQALDAINAVGANRTLVMAPKTLTYNWMAEVAKWRPEYSVGVVPDNKDDSKRLGPGRKSFWKNPPQIVIANYEKMRGEDWPWKIQWDVLICDEASKLKNSTTITWKNIRTISRNMNPDMGYFWALTGTPLEIRLEELYNIFHLIRPAVLGGFSRFRDQHLKTAYNGDVVGVQNLDLLRDRIGYFMLRRTKEEVLDKLPAKLPPQNVFIKMSIEEQKDYQELLADFGEFLEGKELNSGDPMVKTLRMRQFCCTPAIWDVPRRGSKYEALLEIIKDWPGRVVVFCFFEEVTRLLSSWLKADVGHNPEAYIAGNVLPRDRIERVRQFNEGKLGNVFISTDAGQQGLNIVGADLIIHYDQLWNPQKMHQREDRLHRIGQERVVNVINMLYMDTIDYGMYELNLEREELFNDVIEGAEEVMVKKLSPARLKRIAEGKLNGNRPD
jgi:SNF2 family DNA or RNA helicase